MFHIFCDFFFLAVLNSVLFSFEKVRKQQEREREREKLGVR